MLTYSSDACGDLTGQAPATSAAPQIIGQPVDQLVSAGDFASFSVVVADTSGVTFQWAFNGTDIAGATGDSLLLAAVAAANVGQYSVTVTNSAGTVTSSPATLALDSGASTPSSRPRLAAYSDPGGSVTVTPFQRDYALGEPVTLTATPSAPSVFVGWSGISTGDLLATTNPVTVTMTADTTVRARFASPVPLAEGMVAFWRGETDATDLIGGHSGTFYTGTTPTAPSVTAWGKVGGAFAFNGTNYVQVPDAPGLQPPQITLEAWVFPTVLSSTSYQTVIGARILDRRSPTQWWLGVLTAYPSSTPTAAMLLAGPAAIPLNAVDPPGGHLRRRHQGAVRQREQVASQGGLGALAYTRRRCRSTIGADLAGQRPRRPVHRLRRRSQPLRPRAHLRRDIRHLQRRYRRQERHRALLHDQFPAPRRRHQRHRLHPATDDGPGHGAGHLRAVGRGAAARHDPLTGRRRVRGLEPCPGYSTSP